MVGEGGGVVLLLLSMESVCAFSMTLLFGAVPCGNGGCGFCTGGGVDAGSALIGICPEEGFVD